MRSSRLTALFAAALTALALAVTGCGNEAAGTPEAAGSDPGYPRTIDHAMGRTELNHRAQRVVALDTSYVDATLALETKVVGFTDYRTVKGSLPDYLGDARTTYGAEATSVGTLEEPNLEKIAALEPDLIVSAKIRHEKLYDQLSAIAPTIMSETTGATWKDNIRLEAKALGKEDLAEREIRSYEKAARTVGAAINAKAGNPTISVTRFLDGPARLYQMASYSGIVLSDAGLARPKSQDIDDFAAEISPERIKDADADAIFVTVFDDEKGAGTRSKRQFEANPVWKPLAPKVHEVSDTTWMTAVSLQGAWHILADLASTFGVPAPVRR